MKLLSNYIAKIVLASIGLVALMLIGLQIFILFVKQLGDLGKGSYDVLQATWFVFYHLPYRIYVFMPMASLLGSLIGLGMMANHRELVVMRAAGVSIWQVTLSVFKAALIVIVVITILGETLAPHLQRFANDQKIMAMSEGQTLRTSRGMWLHIGNDFITIGTILSNIELRNAYQFRFDTLHHLRLARKLDKIQFKDGIWRAIGVHETVLNDTHTTAHDIANMNWDVAVKPVVFGMGNSEPDEMTLRELRQYIRAQKATKQQATSFELEYWQRIVQPLTTLVMMMIAIPFIFGPLRSSTMGSKLLAGAAVGFGFNILNRFFGPLSHVYQWPPFLAAIIPTCIFALLGVYLMRRMD